MNPPLRKTRIVCISDTHNATPDSGAFKLPPGDVLIHAGDLTKQGTYAELHATLSWISSTPYEAKIVIAGNHDITLDPAFYSQHGASFHNQFPQDSAACLQLFSQFPGLTFLTHASTTIRLRSGPHTLFSIFGSPYSPAHPPPSRPWAFQYPSSPLPVLWDAIPLSADIVVTHTPPKYHCDESTRQEPEGCEALRRALWRVRPRLVVCGHVHEGRGADRVKWDLECREARWKEGERRWWRDLAEGGKGLSRVDLTERGGEGLDWGREGQDETGYKKEAKKQEDEVEETKALDQMARGGKKRGEKDREEAWTDESPSSSSAVVSFGNAEMDGASASSRHPDTNAPTRPQSSSQDLSTAVHVVGGPESTTRGRGGTGGRSDREALEGRLDRKETCVVNAAIMSSSWPYKPGAKRFNKPIVVDVDLEIWEE